MLGSNTLGNLTYAYDLAGRRTGVGGSYARTNAPLAASPATYNVNNQLTQWKGASLTYDGNGNLTGDGTNTYTWNARNQLVAISGGVSASFQYDPFGRRVSKTIGGTTQFLYDGANPVQEISGTTASANLLTGGVDEYFQRTDSAGARNFLTDALGSTLALADSSGTLQTQYTFEPFGNTLVTGTATTNSFAYTGRELDPTGLYFYRARYYSPVLQRFMGEDPIGFSGGTNLYAYAGNNPVSYRDPSGLCRDLGGSGLRICIDTFIPEVSVWGFTGDNRGPLSDGGTFRTQQLLNLSPDGSIGEQHSTGLSKLGFLRRKGVLGHCGVTRLSGRKFRVSCAASDGLFLGLAPNASYDLTFVDTPDGLRVSGYGTTYPNLEVWEYQDGASPQLLFYYSGGTNTNPSDLFGQQPLPPSGYPLPPQ